MLDARLQDEGGSYARRRAGFGKMKPTKHGSFCHAGGRELEIISKHREWVEWAVRVLNEAATREAAAKAETERLDAAMRGALTNPMGVWVALNQGKLTYDDALKLLKAENEQ